MTNRSQHPSPANPAPLLTTEQVARRLHVDPSTVRRWIDDGRLPAARPGRGYRIRPTDLEEFLRVSTTTSQPLTAGRLP